MARLALSHSRDSDRGAASLFGKNSQLSPLSRIYIYILDTHSLVGSDRDFYKDLSTHSSYSKSKSRHGGLGKRTRIGVVVVLRDGDLSYRRIDPRTY